MTAAHDQHAWQRRSWLGSMRAALIAGTCLIAVTAGLACASSTRPASHLTVSHTTEPATPGISGSSGGPPSPSATVPADLRWIEFHGVELPVSRSAGPRYIGNGVAWGFADTPAGALLAAINIGVRANAQWGPPIFGPTIRWQVTGMWAAALMTSCQVAYDRASRVLGIARGRPLGPADVIESAFRWVRYSDAEATVDVVSVGPGEHGTPARVVTQIEVVWSAGDWRVIAPPSGDWGKAAAPLRSMTGYTALPAASG